MLFYTFTLIPFHFLFRLNSISSIWHTNNGISSSLRHTYSTLIHYLIFIWIASSRVNFLQIWQHLRAGEDLCYRYHLLWIIWSSRRIWVLMLWVLQLSLSSNRDFPVPATQSPHTSKFHMFECSLWINISATVSILILVRTRFGIPTWVKRSESDTIHHRCKHSI